MQDGLHQRSSKLRIKNAEGEMVEVPGSRIVRSSGRKDRHSKISTAKGPRDRRVRLSAHTAIQFYDVQDRLGYDRPSKAVDWLIEKAKAAIDALTELPAHNPITDTVITNPQPEEDSEEQSQIHLQHDPQLDNNSDTLKRFMEVVPENSPYHFQNLQHLSGNPLSSSRCFSTAANTPSSSIHFQNYPPDVNSGTTGQTQNLLLSLHPLQDSILHRHMSPIPSVEQALFSLSPLSLPEMEQFQRITTWSSDSNTGNEGAGIVLNSLKLMPQHPFLNQDQLFSHREPLQSSNLHSIRASWMNPHVSAIDHHRRPALDPSSNATSELASDKFLGFTFPARIQGEEEQQGTVPHKHSSVAPPHPPYHL